MGLAGGRVSRSGFLIEQQELHAALHEARQSKQTTLYIMFAAAIAAVAGLVVYAWLLSQKNGEDRDYTWIFVLAGILLLATLAAFIPWLLARRTYMKNQNESFAERIKSERERHQQALEQLKKTTELATLMELNQDQIKTYHDIVTEQADKSFKSARNAMTVGLLLLVAAAAGGVKVPVEEIRWFIGALAFFSTVFSAYLSRTYLMLYRESISQLNRYFDQPVLNSFYLTAERLAAGLEGETGQTVRKQIIDQVLETSTTIGSRSRQRPPEAVEVRPKPKKKGGEPRTRPV
ncbi:hypothetical protein [Streptomyces massasporeus]|uniref:hypothetical protein n=1 Tax=Streptomyces massasporeus TaxID=67324 RepID=UPI003656E367